MPGLPLIVEEDITSEPADLPTTGSDHDWNDQENFLEAKEFPELEEVVACNLESEQVLQPQDTETNYFTKLARRKRKPPNTINNSCDGDVPSRKDPKSFVVEKKRLIPKIALEDNTNERNSAQRQNGHRASKEETTKKLNGNKSTTNKYKDNVRPQSDTSGGNARQRYVKTPDRPKRYQYLFSASSPSPSSPSSSPSPSSSSITLQPQDKLFMPRSTKPLDGGKDMTPVSPISMLAFSRSSTTVGIVRPERCGSSRRSDRSDEPESESQLASSALDLIQKYYTSMSQFTPEGLERDHTEM